MKPFPGLGGHGFYDRYLVLFMPWLMLFLVTACPVARSYGESGAVHLIGATALMLMAAFSIAATHDYLALNRTLWVALADTMRRYDVGPDRIDGASNSTDGTSTMTIML